MGKHKPTFDPSTDCGDYVVATDCAKLYLSGKKMSQKTYYNHTTKPGALKSISAEALMQKWGGGEILRRAVRGMLPKNRLRDIRMERLKGEIYMTHVRSVADRKTVFEGSEHPFKENIVKHNSSS
jgi:large subunit ribosomal protein L13